MMLRFWSQFFINLIAVVVPALCSVVAISILVRAADAVTSGVILWTWFLMTTAGGLNMGLHPSLTNELGMLLRSNSRWPSIVAQYITASNTVLLFIAGCVVIVSISSGSSSLVMVLQILVVWLTGLVSLMMTALNFNGDASRTALSKLLFNTLCFIGPLAVVTMGAGALSSLALLLMLKVIQLWTTAASVKRRMHQCLAPVLLRPINVRMTATLLKRQWRLVAISGTQMSFAFIDRYIVIALYGVAAYKEYGALLDLLGVVWIGSSIFIILLHPQLARGDLSRQEKMLLADRFTRFLVIIGGVVLGTLFLGADWIVGLILDFDVSAEYEVIIRNVIVGLLLNLTYVLYNTLFIATERQTVVLYISIPIFLLYCGLAPAVATEFGLVGLSYAFLFRFVIEAIAFHTMAAIARRAHDR